LDGTYRAELLERGEIGERVVTLDDLRNADGVFLINSVRRRIEVTWVSD
jgi:para-aminobenzoate synthetase/4-amino-4-deoxychorismate lyase